MKKSELHAKLDILGITYKKRDTVSILIEKLAIAQKQIQDVIEHHEKHSKSYFWSKDNGNSSCRTYREKQLNFITKISDTIEYESYVSISRKNFYYKGLFFINGEKVTLKEWKKLLKITGD